jgi:hypothetical protein
VPLDVCFAPESGLAAGQTKPDRIEIGHSPVVQASKLGASNTRYGKLAANYLAFVQLASIRLWLRVNVSHTLVWGTIATRI